MYILSDPIYKNPKHTIKGCLLNNKKSRSLNSKIKDNYTLHLSSQKSKTSPISSQYQQLDPEGTIMQQGDAALQQVMSVTQAHSSCPRTIYIIANNNIQKPINLLANKCQKAMSQISVEHIESQYYLPKIPITSKRKSTLVQQNNNYQYLDTSQSQAYLTQAKDVKLPKVNHNYRLHIEDPITQEPLDMPLFKQHTHSTSSKSLIKRIPPKRLSQAEETVNYRQKNRLGLIILRNKQIEQMKNVQKLIIDVLKKQSDKLDHHFDSLQQELS
ncbi:hypothetical protein pb186bvf_005761 [Paramecium bursaria]